MKKSFLQLLIALSLLAVARHVDAAEFTLTTSASPKIAGTTTPTNGSFSVGSNVVVTANVTNDCYEFVEWTVDGAKLSTNNPYSFTNKARENIALVAKFAQVEYTISTSVSPSNSGTITGGGKKGCGNIATLTAHAKPGFGFVDWSVAGSPELSPLNNPYKFSVSSNESLVANFKDIKPPTVKILSPIANRKVPAAAFPIQGSATDNVGVKAVYYNLNGAGWIQASNTTGIANWYAWVTLIPNSANTVSVYAIDTSDNTNAAVTTKFFCTAAGLAPLSIAGHQAGMMEGTNPCNFSVVSFDLASYVRISACTNNGGEVGTYTYTPTGPDTAELVPQRLLPAPDGGADESVLELTFTNAYAATFAETNGTNGIFNFVLAGDVVPATLDGSVLVGTSLESSNNISTNFFGSSTFMSEGSLGVSSSGTYTFAKFTPVGALVVETVTNPPAAVGTTNYIVMSLTTGKPHYFGYYDYESINASVNQSADSGSFVMNVGTDETKFLGPVTLSGLKAIITPEGLPSFIRTYGNGTFASLSLLSADEPTDVGINLANTRVTGNTGTDEFAALAPPYAVGADDETVDISFLSATKAVLSTGTTVTYSKLATNVPATLIGHTIRATPSGKEPITTTTTFTNNIFASTFGDGAYTYAPYTPTMALVQFTVTSGIYSGETTYFLLEFTSLSGGSYVYSRQVAGTWVFVKGTFTFTATK